MTLEAIAIIPARGGSKGLPGKNTRLFCGKPLIAWMIKAAKEARKVSRVIVSTDDDQISKISFDYGAEVVRRPKEISGDAAASETALLDALQQLKIRCGTLAFLQCTSPLVTSADIDGTIGALKGADSAFAAIPWHGFIWEHDGEKAVPVGHTQNHRPMRQHLPDRYMETGAIYAMDISGFIESKHRFFGKVSVYTIDAERGIDIDDEHDFRYAEAIMGSRLSFQKASRLPDEVKAIVMDFDGVLTNNTMQVDERGQESVVCHRGDGWAIRQFKNVGIHLLILTQESNPAVRARCDKLGVECIVAGENKLPDLEKWLKMNRLRAEDTLYIGNDVPDVLCMMHVACALAPCDAYEEAKNAADIVFTLPGGQGCIRELYSILVTRRAGGLT